MPCEFKDNTEAENGFSDKSTAISKFFASDVLYLNGKMGDQKGGNWRSGGKFVSSEDYNSSLKQYCFMTNTRP